MRVWINNDKIRGLQATAVENSEVGECLQFTPGVNGSCPPSYFGVTTPWLEKAVLQTLAGHRGDLEGEDKAGCLAWSGPAARTGQQGTSSQAQPRQCPTSP